MTTPRLEIPIHPVTQPLALISERQRESRSNVRRRWCRQHLVAAQYFADSARAADEARLVGAGGESVRQRREMVEASVCSAAGFLEMGVSALYLELHESGLTSGRRHSRQQHARLAQAWGHHQRAPVLQKYQLLLSLWDADPFHPRKPPYLEVDRLLRWRDHLIQRPSVSARHIDAEFPAELPPGVSVHVETSRTPEPQVGRLRLSADCAQWAVDSVVTFTREFCCRMGLAPMEFGETGER
ncbi:MAG: hypothetical protein ABIZ91_10970 [Gemmatimonadaceae bacterium]